jgi:hypothetical protein
MTSTASRNDAFLEIVWIATPKVTANTTIAGT